MTVRNFIPTKAPIEAIQFDGTPESALEIINWVRALNPDASIYYTEAQEPWSSPDGKMAHNGVPATLLLGFEHIREGDWVVRGDVVMGSFFCMPNEQIVENFVPYTVPDAPPTGHEEVSDAIHSDVEEVDDGNDSEKVSETSS